MNGTSGFQEVRSSITIAYRFLHEQRHRFGTGAWQLFIFTLRLKRGFSKCIAEDTK
jgi:hypothetical protein